MEIVLKRTSKRKNSTLGELWINGELCFYTLEDKDRGFKSTQKESVISALKVWGRSAIPTGVYQVICNWSNRFKRYMTLVVGVKSFEGIRFHVGNSIADTNGCILIGLGINEEKGTLTGSKKAVEEFEEMIFAAEKIEKITLTIQ